MPQSQDYTTGNLTNWGYNEVHTDTDIAYGGVIYKLFHRAFPGTFEFNSVYAMFPFTVPSENEKIFKGFGKSEKYVFKRPGQNNANTLSVRAESLLSHMTAPGAASTSHLDIKALPSKFLNAVVSCNDWRKTVDKSIGAITAKLLKSNAAKLGKDYWVDVIREYEYSFHS